MAERKTGSLRAPELVEVLALVEAARTEAELFDRAHARLVGDADEHHDGDDRFRGEVAVSAACVVAAQAAGCVGRIARRLEEVFPELCAGLPRDLRARVEGAVEDVRSEAERLRERARRFGVDA